MTAPRLIEVAPPIREISAESVRDKPLRHGHISTLHLWFARRPRAVVFGSLAFDPDHADCPADFRAAVERHLKSDVPDVLKSYRRGRQTHLDPDPYRPYDGQPDTLRNRLLMFIAKWSPEWLAFDTGHSKTEPKPERLLDDRSLVKWETSGPTIKVGSREAPNEVSTASRACASPPVRWPRSKYPMFWLTTSSITRKRSSAAPKRRSAISIRSAPTTCRWSAISGRARRPALIRRAERKFLFCEVC